MPFSASTTSSICAIVQIAVMLSWTPCFTRRRISGAALSPLVLVTGILTKTLGPTRRSSAPGAPSPRSRRRTPRTKWDDPEMFAKMSLANAS